MSSSKPTPNMRLPHRRSALVVFSALALGCATGTPVRAQTRVTVQSSGGQSSPAWIGGAPVHTQVHVGADGQTYVGVWVDAPDQVPGVRVQQRPPMALSLVVDTSGSMSGDKIRNARVAASSLLESLVDGDVVSIYAFSNGIQEIAPPTSVSAGTRSRLMQSVQHLRAGGGTNLYGGVSVGIQRVAQASAQHEVRRVVLISDGHANVGPSDPRSLGTLAANGTEHAVQVSAIGVGLGYDESTLGSLAVQSSGRLYHLEHSHQMAQILEREMQLLASTVATEGVIEIVPAPGVTILEAISSGATLQNGRLRVAVGSLHAGQKREVLFKARIDTATRGAQQLATARFAYRPPGANERRQQELQLRYEVTPSRGPRSVTPRVQAMVASFEAAEAQRRAAEALSRGDRDEAQRQYEFAEDSISGALAAPEMDAASRNRLQRRSRRVRSQRSRASRAATPSEARGVALESYDDAMEAEGF